MLENARAAIVSEKDCLNQRFFLQKSQLAPFLIRKNLSELQKSDSSTNKIASFLPKL